MPKGQILQDNKTTNYNHSLITTLIKAHKLQKKLDKNPNMTIAQLA